MPDLMAIVSKAVFEKAAGKAPKLGARLGMDRYVSANKNLEPLSQGGKLYLVTVRPPDEALWLVCVLEQPHFDGKQWIAAPCTTPLTDISALRSRIKFESGKGMSAAPGTLGMSLQTPRALTAEDVALIAGLAGGGAAPPAPGALAHGVPPAPAEAVSGDAARLAGLLAAVLADPDSDLARQVYADELITRNDPRGEFIQVDLALDGPLSIRRRDLLRARRDQLVKQHAKTWWPYAIQYRVHRGFLVAAMGTLAKIQAAAAALFAAEPVVELEVDGIDDGASKLGRAAWMSRVRRLTARAIDDEGFAALVSGKPCQGLASLNVTANELSAEALEGLGENLPSCRTLVLTGNPIGDEGITALRGWEHLPDIETLYLSQCELTADGVKELLARPLPSLVKLTLTNNELDDSIADVFAARAAGLPRLRVLELNRASLSSKVLEAFSRSKLALTRLDLRGNEIESEAATALPFVRAGQR